MVQLQSSVGHTGGRVARQVGYGGAQPTGAQPPQPQPSGPTAASGGSCELIICFV